MNHVNNRMASIFRNSNWISRLLICNIVDCVLGFRCMGKFLYLPLHYYELCKSVLLADRKVEKFDKNVTKRGFVPETTTSLFQIMRTATSGDTHSS
ncbi:BnaC03g57580D [Brassica napus]|uniref:BnaC03g57580D protein n=3 Tax=Brassica TaxID=3705 RepID=A0A078FBQ4_BRANA|nr:BnaC03g57580D [Brassica napus]